MKLPIRKLSALLFLIGCHVAAQAGEYIFPDDVGVIDVTQEPWNIDNTGVEDVTAKFQQLVDETIPRKTWFSPDVYSPTIIYLPNGTYRLTDSIVGAVLDGGSALGGFVILGQSRDGVILKLDDNAEGFNGAQAKYVLDYLAGSGTNNAFMNQLENVTIDIGAGNSAAVGVRFHANNTGVVRNVKILSSDPALAGRVGLEALKNTNGPWMISGLEVIGFDYGLNLGSAVNGRHMVSVQDLHLEGQRSAAIQLNAFSLVACNTSSVNTVPFVIDVTESAMITLIDSDLSTPDGAASDAFAIESGSPIFLRDVTTSGYAGVARAGENVLLEELPAGTEWHSHPRNTLWEETPDLSLNIGLEQAPEINWPDASDWAIVDSPTFDGDDTEAIRAAMASGKSVIFFKGAKTYRISDTIRIPPHVQLIAGQWASFRTDTGLKGDGRPVFELGDSNYDTVVFDKMRSPFDQQSNPNPLIRNASNSTLVLRDIFWVSGPVYRSEPTRGKVFFENVHSLPGSQKNPLDVPAYEFRGQDVWAYQWNPEMQFPHAIVDGARFVVFGYKTGEMRGPMVDVLNHGYAEMFGGIMNVTHDDLDIDPEDTVLLRSVDGNISANFMEVAALTGSGSGWGRHQYVAQESRNGELRQLLNSDPSVMHRTNFDPQYGAVVNLYTGYFDQDNPSNAAPVPSITRAAPDATGYIWTFEGVATDSDTYPASTPKLHWRVISGPGFAATPSHVGESAEFTFDRAGTYEIEATATDGALEVSQILPIRVTPRKLEERLGRNQVYRYVDNAPQDGEVNLFHPAFLQVGDDAANAQSQLMLTFPVDNLDGSLERIANATLHLRLETVSGLDALQTAYAVASGYGIADADDFKAERVSMDAVSLAGKAAGDWVEIDIRPAVVHAVENGDGFVTIWLQSDFSNNGVGEFVLFSSTVASDSTQRPLFSVEFDAPDLMQESAHLGGTVYFHPAFGYFFDYGSSWISHYKLGWLYIGAEGNNVKSCYLYSSDQGWLYTNESLYPSVYSYADGDWFKVVE